MKHGWLLLFFLQEECKEASPDKHAETWKTLEGVDGVVLPGGFGTRGVEGKIITAKWVADIFAVVMAVMDDLSAPEKTVG